MRAIASKSRDTNSSCEINELVRTAVKVGDAC